jgi:hypothetical protein
MRNIKIYVISVREGPENQQKWYFSYIDHRQKLANFRLLIWKSRTDKNQDYTDGN